MQGHKVKVSTALAVVFILALAGVLVAGMLTYWHIVGADVPCTNQGCDIVAQSPYSRVFGIPVAALGLGYYAFCTALATLLPSLSRKSATWLLAVLVYSSVVGVIVSIYLTYLELVVIHAVCQWCMASAVISFFLLPASFMLRKLYHLYTVDEG
ncbi:MAG: vitamin K epoxide reductase family protein [Armatimonadota bacterium]